MDDSESIPVNRPRRSSSRVTANGRSNGRMYRRDSNLSTSSFLDDVEMAHDEVHALLQFIWVTNVLILYRYLRAQCRRGRRWQFIDQGRLILC
jgi:hypothetical protein